MKIFHSELVYSYDSYSFGYCNYAKLESGDALTNVYEKGYLPYSGEQVEKRIFYMARSVRVPLFQWQLNSENRRIQKRFSDLQYRSIPINQFNTDDENFFKFCLDYFEQRHGKGVMKKDRLHYIFEKIVTNIIEYQKDGKIVAYVFLLQDKIMSHFYYSCYDLSHARQSLGLWLMIDTILRAKEEEKRYVYLGTAYSDKGLYKTNFDGIEFWDGKEWVKNRNLLKQLCKDDSKRIINVVDLWKLKQGE